MAKVNSGRKSKERKRQKNPTQYNRESWHDISSKIMPEAPNMMKIIWAADFKQMSPYVLFFI